MAYPCGDWHMSDEQANRLELFVARSRIPMPPDICERQEILDIFYDVHKNYLVVRDELIEFCSIET
jgi:hypothetical protein